jgi:hypothetical protein
VEKNDLETALGVFYKNNILKMREEKQVFRELDTYLTDSRTLKLLLIVYKNLFY